MPSIQERNAGVARIYGQALLALAEERGEAEALLAELEELAELASRDPDLEDFLSSPLVDAERRRQVIEKLLRGRESDLLVDALQVLNRRGRAGLLPALAAAYRAQLKALRGVVDAEVVSAVALNAELRRKLAAALAGFTGKRPELAERVDPSLLGGLVVEVEGEKIDASLAARLRAFAGALAARAERELGGALFMTGD
jgi:F-type H+-transporting ATPase subunit delta